MSFKLQIVLIALVLLALFVMVKRIRTGKLLLQHCLSWMLLLFAVFVVSLFPALLSMIANAFGILMPVNMVFFVGFCFALVIIFGLTQSISKMTDQIKELTQKIALLENRIREDEETEHENH